MKRNLQIKADNENVNFPTQSCLGSLSNKFRHNDSRELCFKGNAYDYSINYNAIDILNIHKYLMIKNNII